MLRSILLASLIAAPAFAFEVRTDSEGDVVRWTKTVEFVISPNLSEKLGLPGAEAAVSAAVAAVAAHAPNLQLTSRVGSSVAEPGFVTTAPNQNDIVYLEEWPYESAALAATLVTLNARTNAVLDTDIVINGTSAGFRIFDGPAAAGEKRYDLQNMLTHEVGHALGLMHNAEDESAVMFPSAAPGETKKRKLAADDIAGLAELYGAPLPPPALLPGFGCSSSPSAAPLGMLTLLVLFALRRRARLAAAVVAVSAAAALASEPAAKVERAEPEEIAWGEVVQTSARWVPEAKIIVTDVEVEVQRCVKGSCVEKRVKLSVLGGRLGDIEQVVSHQPTPKQGSQVVLTRRSGLLKMIVAR